MCSSIRFYVSLVAMEVRKLANTLPRTDARTACSLNPDVSMATTALACADRSMQYASAVVVSAERWRSFRGTLMEKPSWVITC